MNLYLMDCYYRDPNFGRGHRVDIINIKAPNETDCIKEARAVAIHRKPDYYILRVPGRKRLVVIYDSRNEE
jgi:hypothetical protein